MNMSFDNMLLIVWFEVFLLLGQHCVGHFVRIYLLKLEFNIFCVFNSSDWVFCIISF